MPSIRGSGAGYKRTDVEKVRPQINAGSSKAFLSRRSMSYPEYKKCAGNNAMEKSRDILQQLPSTVRPVEPGTPAVEISRGHRRADVYSPGKEVPRSSVAETSVKDAAI